MFEVARAHRKSAAEIPHRRRDGMRRGLLDEDVVLAADEAELDDIYKTERRLLYVACTRAREHLLLTGVAPVSEYLSDLKSGAI
jgi:ATP-dependent exoDNAse (exonuclease V) beta subunit